MYFKRHLLSHIFGLEHIGRNSEWLMYVPVLNSKEKARELIDIVREQTDAPIGTCVDTVSLILGNLLRDLPEVFSLRDIKNALERDDIIDLDNCYDAKVLEKLTANITGHIEDKGQLDWTIRDDETMLVDALQQFSLLLEKADARIAMRKFRRDDYAFIQGLVSLYHMELRKSVRIELLGALNSLCSLDRSIITMLLGGQLPVLLVLQNKFQVPLTDLDISSLELLSSLFSTGEKFPISHYDILNVEFLTKMVSIVEDCVEAFQFILSFNAHFEPNESTVIQALHNNPPIIFGQLLTVELNRCRADNKDLRAVKLLMDIFCDPQSLITVLFYDNDLKVLYGILCQDLIDTNRAEKMTMILEIMKNIDVMARCGFVQEVVSALRTFLLTRETQPEIRHSAESILQHAREREISPIT